MSSETERQRIDIDTHLSAQPLNRNTALLTLLLAIVLIADGFDIVLLAYLAPAVSAAFQLSTLEMGLVLTIAHCGVALGGVLGGLAGDRIGRRPVLIGSVAGFAIGTLLCAAANGPLAFILARLVAALCMGAASPNIATYLADVLPARWSGRLGFLAYTAYAIGSVLCGVAANTLLPAQGWQSVFVVGGLAPIALLPFLYFFLPESPRFLIRKGRSPDAIAKALSALSAYRVRASECAFVVSSDSGKNAKASLSDLLRNHGGTVAGFSALAALLYFSSVGLTSMGTLILTSAGISPTLAISALLYNNLAGLAGAFLAVLLITRLGSRAIFLILLSSSLMCLGLLAAIFAFEHTQSQALTVTLFSLVGFGLSSSLMLIFPVAAQAFPVGVRASGTGLVTSLGRIGSIVCSAVIGFTLVRSGAGGVFLLATLLVAATLLVVAVIKQHVPPQGPVIADPA